MNEEQLLNPVSALARVMGVPLLVSRRHSSIGQQGCQSKGEAFADIYFSEQTSLANASPLQNGLRGLECQSNFTRERISRRAQGRT